MMKSVEKHFTPKEQDMAAQTFERPKELIQASAE
jgi:hypothetical protein